MYKKPSKQKKYSFKMDNIFANPVRNSIIISVLCAVLISAGTFLFVKKMRSTYTSEVDMYLVEVAKQSAAAVKVKMTADLRDAEDLARILGRDFEPNDIYRMLSFLEQERLAKGFKRVGLIFPDGRNYLSSGMTWEEMLSHSELTPEQKRKNDAFSSHQAQGKTMVSDRLFDREDGTPIIVQNVPIFDDNGKYLASVFTTKALSEYKKEFASNSFKGEGYFYLVSGDGNILLTSGSDKALLNIGENLFKYITEEEPGTEKQLLNLVKAGQTHTTEYYYKGVRKYASFVPIGVNDWYMFFVIDSGKINKDAYALLHFTVILGIFISLLIMWIMLYIIYSARHTEESLFKLAYVDPLIKCANVNKLSEDIKTSLAKYRYDKFAFIMLDIDKFKVVNNMYTNKQGNLVLQHVANVLDASLQEGEAFGRIFADMFGMLIKYDDDKDITARIETLNKDLIHCYALLDSNFHISFSFGIYRIGDREQNSYEIFDKANIARLNLKKIPGQYYAFYSQFFTDDIVKEKFVENNIKNAQEKHEIEIYYQPKYSLQNGRIIGAEALARWRHPTKGMIRPDEFIPIIERTGKIIPFDIYVLENTAKAIRRWMENGVPLVNISVNHSRLHFANKEYPDLFNKIVCAQGISPKWIELEVTEGAVMDSQTDLIAFVDRLHSFGFSCSMDDFGSGYSSLNVLKELPADVVKLDKQFLRDFDTNQKAKDIIISAIQMIRKINMKVVAEGIETREQADFLKHAGCDYAQGYLFSKPLPEAEFIGLLREQGN